MSDNNTVKRNIRMGNDIRHISTTVVDAVLFSHAGLDLMTHEKQGSTLMYATYVVSLEREGVALLGDENWRTPGDAITGAKRFLTPEVVEKIQAKLARHVFFNINPKAEGSA